jgi:hypothetical protein
MGRKDMVCDRKICPTRSLMPILVLVIGLSIQTGAARPEAALAAAPNLAPTFTDVDPAQIYTVTGQVTGPSGPIVGATVFFDCCAREGFGIPVDASGVYSFTTDGPQAGSLIAAPPLETRLGQAARHLSVSGDMTGVDFHLSPGHLLSGRVVSRNGLPVNLDHDLYNSRGVKQYLPFSEYGEFALFLPPDQYTLRIGPPGQPWESHDVDLRSGNVLYWTVVVDIPDQDLPLPPEIDPNESPPLADRIAIGAPDARGVVHIGGAAGAIPQNVPYLDIVNLHIGSFATAAVRTDGSFEADILAPYGSALQLRLNKGRGQYTRSSGTGTILWVYPPGMGTQEGQVSVYLAGRAGDIQGHWRATGALNDAQFSPGEPFTATLDIAITGPQVDTRFDRGDYRLAAFLNFERFFDATGQHHARVQRGTSTSFTPTGLPIDAMSSNRWQEYTPLTLGQETTIQAAHRTGNVLHLRLDLAGTLPVTLPHGLYRPALALLLGPEEWLAPLPGNPLLCSGDPLDSRAELGLDENGLPAYLPIIRVGAPAAPRLPWALLVNAFSNGTRGTIAREERGQVGLSNRIAFQPDRLILSPRSTYGQALSYRLEPFLPTLSSSLASDVEPYPPILPLRFPAGSLQVTVSRPDGSVDRLGTAPFRQARNGMEARRWNYYIGGDRTLQKVYEVTTLTDDFVYSFEQYGRHLVRMTGTVQDVWGHTYAGGGTFEVWIAETLDLEPAVFPGQPFEVGDPLAMGVVVQPSIPAMVTLSFMLVPGNGTPIRYSISGRANRYGHFQPAAAAFNMPAPGEYVLDITAEYWDEQGVYWAGASRGAGVVETPGSALIAHGLRGITVFTDNRPQWFLASQVHPKGYKENFPDIPEDDSFMTLYPYHTGDILWTSDRSNSIVAELSIQDQAGWYESLLRSRDRQVRWNSRVNRSLEDRAALGELPLVTTTPNDHEWSLHPETVDQWGYAYLSTQRPGVSVRGYVGTDNLFRTYWSTDYKYDRQFGNGSEGDWEDDIKLQYGGAVIRTDQHKEYLGYASMEVLIPFGQDDLGIRTFPPFQGHSGGPDGGPILTFKGEEIDLFVTPTGLRPGTVLEVGDTVAVAGTMWPTLDSKGWFTFTAPSGVQRIVHGQANRFGYLYAADDRFVVNEPGVWTVETHLLHDALVPSTGLAPTGHNTGDLLGARPCDGWASPVGCGQFYFYVTRPGAPPLALDGIPRLARLPRPIPLSFKGDVPNGWTNVEGRFTASMSGYILEEGDLALDGGRWRYTFDPWQLHDDVPNLDVSTLNNLPELVDTFTFSFMLFGRDGSGREQHRASSVVLQGLQLQALLWQPGGTVYLPTILRQQ